MGWIKERIEAEHRKHGSMPEGMEKYNLDWARLAEAKILSEIRENLKTKLQKIQDARDWSIDLSYPYPESHAIWMGEEQMLKRLLEELDEDTSKVKEASK